MTHGFIPPPPPRWKKWDFLVLDSGIGEPRDQAQTSRELTGIVSALLSGPGISMFISQPVQGGPVKMDVPALLEKAEVILMAIVNKTHEIHTPRGPRG